MLKRLRSALSPSMVVALAGLFVALGGPSYAATGANFILGTPNSATSVTELSASGPTTNSALKLTNTSSGAGSTALELNAPAGHPPMKVNRSTKVANLNVDWLDGIDGGSFLRKGIAQSLSVSSAGGVVDVTNTGTTNGVQGKTGGNASGVYGEHIGPGGFGTAGRAGDDGNAVYGDNTGTGWAGYFEDKVHVGGNLDLSGTLDCSGCVAAGDISGKVGDADTLDGIDSTGFIKGTGGASGQAIAEAPGANSFLGPTMFGFLRLRYQCPASLGSNGTFTVFNSSAGIVNIFIESGEANPLYFQLASGASLVFPSAPNGESFHIQAQGSLGVITVEAATVHRASTTDCHAQAQGVLAQ